MSILKKLAVGAAAALGAYAIKGGVKKAKRKASKAATTASAAKTAKPKFRKGKRPAKRA